MAKKKGKKKPPRWLHWLGDTWGDVIFSLLIGILILAAIVLFVWLIDSMGVFGVILMILVLVFL